MKVQRCILSDGYRTDEKPITYTKAQVVGLDRHSTWPGTGVLLKTVPWPEFADRPKGYQQLRMYGADIYVYGSGYIATGFVGEEENDMLTGVWRLERWYCGT